VGYSKQCGGLDNVATILSELSEKLDSIELVKIAEKSPISWSQRLGYLLNVVDAGAVSEGLAQHVKACKPVRTPLLPAADIKGSQTDSLWKVFVNTKVESDV